MGEDDFPAFTGEVRTVTEPWKPMSIKPLIPVFIGLAVVVVTLFSAWYMNSVQIRQGSVSEAESPTPIPSSPENSPSSEEVETCTDAETAVTMVRNIFEEQSATPNQVSLILNEAANMWAAEANVSIGSKSEWLRKMNELVLQVDSYLLSGSPSDGPQKFDQLFANMSLVGNFCN